MVKGKSASTHYGVDEYLVLQRREGKVFGKRLRAAMGEGWTEEKNVWAVPIGIPEEEKMRGLEEFRVEIMRKYNRHPDTTWTVFINGSDN